MADPALFRSEDGFMVPTGLTRGGWSDEAQHGSPPVGLLARAVERQPTSVPMQVVRLTVDLFREVPLTPLSIETEVLREGLRIQLVQVRLLAGSRQVGQAQGLKIRMADLGPAAGEIGVPEATVEVPAPGPEELEVLDWREVFGDDQELPRFHNDAVEIRTVDHSFVEPVVGVSWFRLKVRLVEDEELTPFQRVALVSDLANGNSQALDPRRWLFVNPDLTLYLHRYPIGEWLCMRSGVAQSPNGIGVTDSVLYDQGGPVGRINQAQLIDHR
ncbi:MAG: thioesterase family protein [Acidimicrobiia bacterium]